MLSESTICLFLPTQIIVTRFLFMDNLWAIYGNLCWEKGTRNEVRRPQGLKAMLMNWP